MKTYPECLPCLLKQAIQAARLVGADEKNIMRVAAKVEEFLETVDIDKNPPSISRNMHRLIRAELKDSDPYLAIKEKYNRIAMEMYESVKVKVKGSNDPLLAAVRAAIAGNVIDFGVQLEFDLEADLNDIMRKDFAAFDYESFKEALSANREVLYLGDNTGETVFDRILIEEIKRIYGTKITYAVKESPILNDALHEDAVFAGIDKIADVISSGADSPGIVLEYASEDFKKRFYSAGMIISKGQGNFESLYGEPVPAFFLLKLKCEVIAKHIGLPLGGIVLKKG
ncbi:MAG: DUF89 family protein [Candidatus Goldbacteria bacterium]|nr:DUF89 family protein [Candidatus Goldiibacteriota bacterium]